MEPYLSAFFQRLQDLHDGMRQCIDGLDQAALDWEPMPDSNSLAVLVVHTMGAQRYWIGDVAGQEPSGRDRDAEFRVKDMPLPALLELIERVEAHSQHVLTRLKMNQLEQIVPAPGRDQTFMIGWALHHALEHTGLHLGHMQITRQWWDHR